VASFVNITFPSFLTNQRWQFGWGTWYSRRLPSRQSQFTEQTPAHRQPFWGFPHASISTSVTTTMVSALYDKVIATNIVRLAELNSANVNPDSSSCTLSDGQATSLTWIVIFLSVTFGLITAGFIYMFYQQRKGPSYALVEN
jgi:hypothetical protein